MADLSTLEAIGNERQTLYGLLVDGTISEQRAIAAERVLSGQQKLKELPFRVLQVFTRLKSIADEPRQREVLDIVMRNMGAMTKAPALSAKK
jgi:predicted ABC-type exoprotein transport system permease subunit